MLARRLRSVGRPKSRRSELDRAMVRIAEVDAGAAALPRHAALDRDAERREPRFPRGEILAIDREGEVSGPAGLVTGDDAARCRQRIRVAALEEQQQRPLAGVEDDEPFGVEDR